MTAVAVDLPASSLAVLDALEREYRANGGWPVRVRRLCALTDRSLGAVHHHLGLLIAAGVVERGPGQAGFRPRVGGGFR